MSFQALKRFGFKEPTLLIFFLVFKNMFPSLNIKSKRKEVEANRRDLMLAQQKLVDTTANLILTTESS